ncbi:DUF5995 family protein [Salinirubellus salinus]|uniref:DUF5995 family protein n=1 Tax=Salinirubellus salinus TaxID=1364945 RepID=A0A9E7U9E2_9EURY|nr:DUF5995 family protein [Salinirubellus salinus]UWM53163.1 DUF5995 family protein [Salinirubellus salinus]
MRETFREGRLTTRALRRGVRTHPGETYAGGGDPALLDLVTEPFDGVADTRERLLALERALREREDGRAAFLTVYARVTSAVEAGVDDGRFADPHWVARYLVAFADHYRRAFDAFERGDLRRVPDPWQLAFDRACSPDTLVLQDVLLGVNAHVNYDLALALHDVGIDPERPRKRADHRAINETLASLVDEEQELLAARYAPGIADIDASLGRLDEALSMFTLRQGRRHAWRGAVALSLGRRVERPVKWTLNAVSLGTASAVLAPTWDERVAARLRAAERGA